MAFGSMLGARFKKKKVPMEKETGNWMEMALDPWILPWDFGKGAHRSSTDGFGWEAVTWACPTKPQQGFPVTKEGQEL